MIPADYFHDNGDGTAWWVFDENGPAPQFQSDRPCDYDACNQGHDMRATEGVDRCPNHCIGGRHTFDIEVDMCNNDCRNGVRSCDGVMAHRVSIVPGMVLPICEAKTMTFPGVLALGSRFVYIADVNARMEPVTLPPAAAPGMWAVKVRTS